MELRGKLEDAFQNCLPSDGTADRDDYAKFLVAVGLSDKEAKTLLDGVGPIEHIKYNDFLELVFSGAGPPAETEQSKAEPAKTEQSKEELDANAVDESYVDTMKIGEPKIEDEPGSEPKPQDELSAEPKTQEDASEEPKPELSPKAEPSEEPKPQEEAKEEEKEEPKAKEPKQKKEKSDVKKCEECGLKSSHLYQDDLDLSWYCYSCWISWYSIPPPEDGSSPGIPRLVNVVSGKTFQDCELLFSWIEKPITGWPPQRSITRPVNSVDGDPTGIGKSFVPVNVTIHPGLVGSHARQASCHERQSVGEVLSGRYRIEHIVGAGHFAKAFLAHDIQTDKKVCVKRQNNLTIELMTDLLTIGKRVESVDPDESNFPKLVDAFWDMVGYTVETLLEGRNCLEMLNQNPAMFKDVGNVKIVADGGFAALKLLSEAGIVHCDVKPDNIMWIEADGPESKPRVKLVDFGCSRLDSRLESGRNWALAEGGAGHTGKWPPEMHLRLAITDRADVWGLAVALLELYSKRFMWNCEADTSEFILAQCLGLVNAKDGLPQDLMRRSPLDIRQLYTPAPSFFPVKRTGSAPNAKQKELRPATWGLECVLGPEETWDAKKQIFADFIKTALVMDPLHRPSALDLLQHAFLCQALPESELEPTAAGSPSDAAH